MRRKQLGRPINFLAGIIKRAGSQNPKSLAPGTLKPAVSQPLRQNTPFSQMDLFTVIAIAIVVVLIITLVVMGGWLR